jgi:integrase
VARKRANGEGTVRQRGDGKWEGYTPRDEFGKRRKVIRGTQREVLSALAGFRAQAQRARDESGAKQTVAALLDVWFSVKRQDLRPKTADSYSRTIRDHLTTAPFARLRIEKLTSGHVETWYDALRAKADRTARYAKRLLAQALDYAVDRGWLSVNAARAKHLKRKAKAPKPYRPLTLAEARALLDAVSSHRLEALYIVALSLGLRRGEVLALRWDDLDLVRGTLKVSGTLQRVAGNLQRGQPKTEASAATLPLPRPVVVALLAHQARQQVEREKLSEIDAWTECGLVFVSNVGTPIEPRNLIKQFKRMLKKAGLPETIRFHDLRHSCATLLIAQGVHPRVVMQHLRHTRISTTMDTYGHIFEDAHAAAAEQLGALLELSAEDERVIEFVPKDPPKSPHKRG